MHSRNPQDSAGQSQLFVKLVISVETVDFNFITFPVYLISPRLWPEAAFLGDKEEHVLKIGIKTHPNHEP